jgi:hypothetical protein
MDETNGRLGGLMSDHFIRRYRQLLDAEDAAFDELEHAFEEGDRAHYEIDLAAWERCVDRRQSFLDRHGLSVATPLTL